MFNSQMTVRSLLFWNQNDILEVSLCLLSLNTPYYPHASVKDLFVFQDIILKQQKASANKGVYALRSSDKHSHAN